MLSKITSVEGLIEILDGIDLHEFPKAIKSIDIRPQALEPYATWTANDYTRNCLARSKKYELILLCWDKHSKTPVHDYGGEDCWVYQIAGSVQEIRYNCINGKCNWSEMRGHLELYCLSKITCSRKKTG